MELLCYLLSSNLFINMVTRNIYCVKTVSFIHATKKVKIFFITEGKKSLFHNQLAKYSIQKKRKSGACVILFQKSDCNTRRTSIKNFKKEAERNRSMTGCICRLERGDISGSSTRDTLALVLQWSPAAVVFHSSVVCGLNPGFPGLCPHESLSEWILALWWPQQLGGHMLTGQLSEWRVGKLQQR